jgi:uncharacterized protein (TIGR02466 family)
MKLIQLYSVPFWQSEYPDFEEHKETFFSAIKEYKEQTPTTKRSNIGGYQSPNTLHYVEELRPLFEYICQMGFKACADLDFVDCELAITAAWLNVNDSRGCMNCQHVHNDIFSGVFYLSAPEGSGKLCVINPAINPMWDGCLLVNKKNQFTSHTVKIEPEEGSIVFFPGYLPHYVEPNDHDEERISIAFNMIVLPKGSIEDYPQS